MGASRMPDFLKRVRERRRLRVRRRDREDLLLELGALVFELHRQGQRAPELLQAQAAALDVVDRDVRLLEGTLDPEADGVPAANWGETGGWQAEGDWPETGEWQQPEAEQTSDWAPADGELPAEPGQADDDATQEWQAPEQGEEADQQEQQQ
jgi:hypothetical protein